MNRSQSGSTIPWIDWTAQCISDPIVRLRFLRVAAPAWQPERSRKLRWACSAGLSLLAFAGLLAAGRLAIARRDAKAFSHDQTAVTMAASPVNAAAIVIPAGMALPKTESAQEIWQVEKTAAFETYSNGLRIDNKFSTANHPRSYLAFAAARSGGAHDRTPDKAQDEARTTPAGIVYHTTESLQAPFVPGQNGKLKQVGESLLDYVKRKKAYNFVIDRFGRVYRVVQETDAAEHAGYSVWSDEKWLYVNLNESFIGVSVETQTYPGQMEAAVTSAQIRATAMLTEMLRSRYNIAAGNCVTHAQVSVNPTRMLAGYHMDWASSFPFEEIGLPNNYARPLPSIAAFGFECDATYSRTAGARLSAGAGLGAWELAERAAAAGMTVSAFRKLLQSQYRDLLAATRGAVVSHEGD
ncbi:MAG: peptidoglycan recognition family protein [Bryobacteraceae bacterium]